MGGVLHSDERLRRMYAGGRADATARRLSHIWAWAFRLGLLPKRWVTLEVAGRRSGRPVRFPLGMAHWDRDWYLTRSRRLAAAIEREVGGVSAASTAAFSSHERQIVRDMMTGIVAILDLIEAG